MKRFSTSLELIKNSKNFIIIHYYSFLSKLLLEKGIYYGWGRKESGLNAIKLAKKHNTSFVLLEDGFIRSLHLGVNGSPSFSLVEDNIGIYYDATQASKLENILNTYNFELDTQLMKTAKEAIALIRKYKISKYNNSQNIKTNFFKTENKQKVLIIAQTAGDSSLKYGMLDNYTTEDMINAAITENPYAEIYIKIHPDVLTGKKDSDIDIKSLNQQCIIIKEDINPISLLKHFSKVYTKTSQMGFEAILVGCECICFGMPFYAGWGITIDKSTCNRRQSKHSMEEVFAGAYILYTSYYNPYSNKKSTILDTIKEIIIQKYLIESI